MKKRSVVIRKKQCFVGPQIKKRKIKIDRNFSAAGFASPLVVAIIFSLFSALFYIHSINQSAVKGFQIKTIEKEISQIKKENELLKIKEAELKSLHKIEQFGRDAKMLETKEVIFIDESNSLALN